MPMATVIPITTSARPNVEIDPSISWNATLGIAALREHLGKLADAVKDDEHMSSLALQAIWMAEKIAQDIDAAWENADEAATCIVWAVRDLTPRPEINPQ